MLGTSVIISTAESTDMCNIPMAKSELAHAKQAGPKRSFTDSSGLAIDRRHYGEVSYGESESHGLSWNA